MRASDPMSLLGSGVPLSLLLDLLDAGHLPSRSICRREGGDAAWLPERLVPGSRRDVPRSA